MTTQSQIKTWIDVGSKQGASYMLVVCDTFEHEDYPVYAKSETEAHEKISEYREASMQRTMEVYNLLGDIDAQLAADRTWAIDEASRYKGNEQSERHMTIDDIKKLKPESGDLFVVRCKEEMPKGFLELLDHLVERLHSEGVDVKILVLENGADMVHVPAGTIADGLADFEKRIKTLEDWRWLA